MLTCGLLRSNFSFAIASDPQSKSLERGTGFEPATIALEERDSTVELPPPVSLWPLTLVLCRLAGSPLEIGLLLLVTGAWDRDWTGDLVLTKDALYQLSYPGPRFSIHLPKHRFNRCPPP